MPTCMCVCMHICVTHLHHICIRSYLHHVCIRYTANCYTHMYACMRLVVPNHKACAHGVFADFMHVLLYVDLRGHRNCEMFNFNTCMYTHAYTYMHMCMYSGEGARNSPSVKSVRKSAYWSDQGADYQQATISGASLVFSRMYILVCTCIWSYVYREGSIFTCIHTHTWVWCKH